MEQECYVNKRIKKITTTTTTGNVWNLYGKVLENYRLLDQEGFSILCDGDS